METFEIEFPGILFKCDPNVVSTSTISELFNKVINKTHDPIPFRINKTITMTPATQEVDHLSCLG